MRSSSSGQPVSARTRILEALKLLRMKCADRGPNLVSEEMLAREATYAGFCERYLGMPLDSVKAFEVGYGARPYLLWALRSAGVSVEGADIDRPLTHLSIFGFIKVARDNGVERAAKSAARAWFDRRDAQHLNSAYAALGRSWISTTEGLHVGTAQVHLASRTSEFDLIYSEDVLEHIPVSELRDVIAMCAKAVKPQGILVFRPMIWTGIAGGHDPDWYKHKIPDNTDRDGAWGHLTGTGPKVNTYLNKLRLGDYKELFAAYFQTLEVIGEDVGLGEQYLTEAVRSTLTEYSTEELFSNNVWFILRPLSNAASAVSLVAASDDRVA